MWKGLFLIIAIGAGAVLLACSGAVPGAAPTQIPETPRPSEPTAVQSSPTTVTTPTQEAMAEPVSLGLELFRTRGCAACHGQNAEGTNIAPALNGHTGAQVKRQARAPLGIMPVFPPDKVSNEELEAIAEFIEGLDGGHAHIRAPGSPDEIALHHWMALFSIDAEDPLEAAHHLGHIIELTQGQHQANMREAVSLLEKNEMDEAAHLIQQMLAGLEQVDIDESTMHLTLALSSARVEDANVAIHHVEHFLETASGEEAEAGERILAFLNEDRVHDAQDELEELLGGSPIEEHEDAEEDDDHSDDTEDDHEEEPPPSTTN